ncbi:hypothetical protein B9Z19DRAFT_988225 [Tuber borchii]|uniref:T6SS Phospholipase effector Tle1-like catalytic domain-containing protein n=1 Tax=Tuber borchii TaxID=42251 RepID=A0A2T6ZNN3_TUBBO|nr:hypothetical protein B9Z19DRAFT_988225 [Tuber borchii]
MSNPSSSIEPKNKRIIVCCDGTWQNSDGGNTKAPTNVTRITRALKSYTDKGISQVVYYQSGVGTGGPVDRLVGGGVGYGLSEHVREAYGFLAHNYHPGDEIHLIGFSRGAYTARSICGLISRIGILTKRGMDGFHEVYDEYKAKNDNPDENSWVPELQAKQGGSLVDRNAKIKTISCWDTVGSLGIPTLNVPIVKDYVSGINHARYDFHDTNLSLKVENAFHALALDEERIFFEPTLWKKTEEWKEMEKNKGAKLKQCWFPGVHSDIGGGWDDQEIADMTLAWMMQQLLPFLEFDDSYLDNIIRNSDVSKNQWANGEIHYETGVKKWTLNWNTRTPGMQDDTNEKIHKSVRIRMDTHDSKWSSKALGGWECNRKDGIWTKGAKTIAEDELGPLEKKLAGKAVVRDILKEDMPQFSKKSQ